MYSFNKGFPEVQINLSNGTDPVGKSSVLLWTALR